MKRQKGISYSWWVSVLSVILLITGCVPSNPPGNTSNTPTTNASENTTRPPSGDNSTKVTGDVPGKIPDNPSGNLSKNTPDGNSHNATGNATQNASPNGQSNNITKPSGPSPLPLMAANSLKLIYADNFSDNKSGWPSSTSANDSALYQNGEYQVSNNDPGFSFWVWNKKIDPQNNFVADVTARPSNMNHYSSFGLIFQLDDQGDNFYAFEIWGNRYSVWEHGTSNATLQAYTNSTYIKTDDSVNQLRVVRLDKTIEVYVNGQRLVTVTDGSLIKGRIGFWVSDVTSVAFTDFKLYNFTDDYISIAAPNLLPKIVKQNVGPAGGIITVNWSGSTQSVFQITVPKDTYADAQPFQITTQDVPSPDPNFVAGSPLITIENGGGISSKPITIKIPVTYTADEFPTVCEIDEAGNFEPTTTSTLDKNSIGVTYYIFPKTLKLMVLVARNQTLSKIEAQQLQTFKPGKDDWHFVNPNTFTSNGNCAGMSMTAIYYYDEMYSKGKGANLYGRYLGKLTDLDEDDRQAFRLVSLVQQAYENSLAYLERLGTPLYSKDNPPLVISSDVNGDEITYKSFVAAIAITKQPQLIFMWGRDKSTNESVGHAMIVYGCNNSLLLADPNNPGAGRLAIPFINGKLGPYDTNLGNTKSGDVYNTFQFIGRGGAFISWSSLGDFWGKINDSSIGASAFPTYSVKLADDQGKIYSNDIKDGANISVNRSRIIFTVSSSENLSLAICRDGLLNLEDFPPSSHSANVDLNKGVNLIGIYVYAYNGTCDSQAWTDFRWVTVTSDPSETWVGNLTGSSKISNYSMTGTFNHNYLVNFTVKGSLASSLNGTGYVSSPGVLNGGSTIVSQTVTSSRYASDKIFSGSLTNLNVTVSAPNYGEIWIFANEQPIVLYSYSLDGKIYQANAFKGFVLIPKSITATTITGDWRTADISGYSLGGLSGTFTLNKQEQ